MSPRPTRPSRSSKSTKRPAKPSKPSKAAGGRAKRPAARRQPSVDTARTHAADERSHQRALAVARAALDKKAEDVLVIDVRGLTSIAEYFVVASGTSGPNLRAIAESVETELKKQGVMPLSVEGQAGGNWVLLDYGDVVAHVFEAEVRGFYDLEGLWADAPREKLS